MTVTQPNADRAKALIVRIDAALADKPINAPRFATFRTELTTALAEGGSYLDWALADWAAAIEFELGCVERRRTNRMAA